RHTRFSRDWSSDVCSSDLDIGKARDRPRPAEDLRLQPVAARALLQETVDQELHQMNAVARGIAPRGERLGRAGQQEVVHATDARSEERRVGKDGRSRWTLD